MGRKPAPRCGGLERPGPPSRCQFRSPLAAEQVMDRQAIRAGGVYVQDKDPPSLLGKIKWQKSANVGPLFLPD